MGYRWDKVKSFTSGLIRDETGSPSSSKIQQWCSWFVVMGAFINEIVNSGLATTWEFALGLLGLGAVGRGMSQFNNYKYKSTQPKPSLFSKTDNGQGSGGA